MFRFISYLGVRFPGLLCFKIKVCKVAKQYAPEYDCEAIYHRLKDEEDSFKR